MTCSINVGEGIVGRKIWSIQLMAKIEGDVCAIERNLWCCTKYHFKQGRNDMMIQLGVDELVIGDRCIDTILNQKEYDVGEPVYCI